MCAGSRFQRVEQCPSDTIPTGAGAESTDGAISSHAGERPRNRKGPQVLEHSG